MGACEHVSNYNWHTEGAAFLIDYNTDPEQIAIWVEGVESMSGNTIKKLLSSQEAINNYKPRELLLNAAYFADHAMIYPSITPKGPPRDHTEFMFPDILRNYIQYPG